MLWDVTPCENVDWVQLRSLAGKICSTISETIFIMHYVIIKCNAFKIGFHEVKIKVP
jgi:hypothetical protein